MGWTYNLFDPNVHTSAPIIAGVGIFFTILSFSFLCLRLYVRRFVVKSVSIDDWLIVGTWLFSFMFLCIILAQTRWGLGIQSLEAIPIENRHELETLQYASAPFYITAILGFKLSILFTFLRMAVDRTYRTGIIGISSACSMFHFCYFVAQLSLCKPVTNSLEPMLPTASCSSAITFYTAMNSLTLIFDISIMLVPIPILLHSCFSIHKNITIGILFLLGTFISLIQIIRIITYQSQASYLTNPNIATWSLIEINLGIIISSLLPLSSHPKIKAFLEKGPPQSLTSLDSRRTMEKLKHGMKRKLGQGSEFRGRVLLFLGYGELRPDLEREQGPGNRLGNSTEELHLHFPMEILKTTEIIVSREGSSWGEIKEDEVS